MANFITIPSPNEPSMINVDHIIQIHANNLPGCTLHLTTSSRTVATPLSFDEVMRLIRYANSKVVSPSELPTA